MEVIRHQAIIKDLKSLKRFPAPEESLAAWERLFCLKGLRETPAIESFPGFGNYKVFKGRVVPLQENVSKAKGYRVVFQMTDNNLCRILVFSRHGIYHTEGELIALIQNRLNDGLKL